MKCKTLLLPVFILFALTSQAQKNSWYIGGNTGFANTSYKTETNGTNSNTGKISSWSLSPEIGTFLTNNLAVGLGVTFNGTKSDPQNNLFNTTRQTMTGGTAYTRYFFGKEAFKPFAGFNVSVLSGKGKTTSVSTNFETTTNSFGANLNAGFSYAVSKRVNVLGSMGFLGYRRTSSTQTGTDLKQITSEFGIDANSLGDRFNIGFYFTL